MQGKYQLQVFPESGHFVHEDCAGKTAMVVADFYRRNDRSGLVLPPKVDELIRSGKVKGMVGAGGASSGNASGEHRGGGAPNVGVGGRHEDAAAISAAKQKE
jgi:hypothetical protein